MGRDTRSVFRCTECGAEQRKWAGQCKGKTYRPTALRGGPRRLPRGPRHQGRRDRGATGLDHRRRVRLVEPSTDLAVVAALVSSVRDRPLPPDAIFLGEVGLGGEVRPIAAAERRLAEAGRQGFRRVFLSSRSRVTADGLELVGVEGIGELAGRLAA